MRVFVRWAWLSLAFLAACGGGGDPPPPNLPATATPQSLSTPRGVPLPVTLAGTDPEGATLGFAVVTPPAHGALSGTPPLVTYTPAAGWEGPDAFTFAVFDGLELSAAATVSISVTHVNSAPVPAPDAAATDHATPVTVAVLANDTDLDGDALVVTAVTQPAHGSAALVAGGVRYQPAPGFSGDDAFAYTVGDGLGGLAQGSVTVTVRSAATLVLSTAALSFAAPRDGPAPASQLVTVSNGGSSRLRWTASADVPWLTVSPAAGEGSVAAGAFQVAALPIRAEGWSRPTSMTGAPSPRYGHAAAWTGREVIVWGGREEAGGGGAFLGDGARYDPAGDAWSGPLSTDGAPSPRNGHAAAWTGRELIVWGGQAADGSYLSDGARYDPRLDRWSPMATAGAPSGRETMVVAWTGTELLAWGGSAGGAALADGARYDPATDTWRSMSSVGAPSPRARAAAAFTGAELLVWGGLDGATLLGDGARYDPAADAWLGPLPAGGPSARAFSSAAWTGEELVIWGGQVGDTFGVPIVARDGARLRPGVGWVGATSMQFGPVVPQRLAHVAAWTGAELIVWGGYGAGGSGGRYTPPLALAPGLHHGAVRVSDPGSTSGTATVAVTLEVTPQARLGGAFTLASATGPGDYVYPVSLAAAGDGGLFAAGTLAGGASTGGLTFGAGQAGEVTLAPPAGGRAWLARVGAGGALGWARLATAPLAGSTRFCWATAAALTRLADGSLLMGGRFAGEVVFGPGDPGQVTLASDTAGGNAFLASFDEAGAVRWARRAAGVGASSVTSLAATGAGGALAAGWFDGALTLGPGEVHETTLTAATQDGFLLRVGADGALAWAQAVAAGPGGFPGEPLVAVAAGPGDTALVTGEFSATASFGGGTPTTLDAGPGSYALFLARYQPDGALDWVRQTAGPASVIARAVAAQADGSALVTGSFSGQPVFGPGGADPVALGGAGAAAFLARYDASGALTWVRSGVVLQVYPVGGGVVHGSSEGEAVLPLPDGAAILAGHFDVAATWWPGATSSAGDFDHFFGRLDPDGRLAWVRSGGGAGADLADAAVLASDGAVLLGARARGDATFGAGEPGEVTLSPAVGGAGQVVVVRFVP